MSLYNDSDGKLRVGYEAVTTEDITGLGIDDAGVVILVSDTESVLRLHVQTGTRCREGSWDDDDVFLQTCFATLCCGGGWLCVWQGTCWTSERSMAVCTACGAKRAHA